MALHAVLEQLLGSVVVHRHEIIWTLSVTVKPQAAIGYDPAPREILIQ